MPAKPKMKKSGEHVLRQFAEIGSFGGTQNAELLFVYWGLNSHTETAKYEPTLISIRRKALPQLLSCGLPPFNS